MESTYFSEYLSGSLRLQSWVVHERAVGRDSGVFLREGKSEADLKRFRGWLPLKALIAFVSSDAKAVLGIYENERRKT